MTIRRTLAAWCRRGAQLLDREEDATPVVTTATLMAGSWWALGQCGRLLHATRAIYRTGDLSTALALAMLAREELGKSKFLERLAWDTHNGKTITTRRVQRRMADHLAKQKAGYGSTVLRLEADHPLSEVFRRQMDSAPGSKEWTKAQSLIDREVERVTKEQPALRHSERIASTYVDINDDGQSWLLPKERDADLARQAIEHSINDYALSRDRHSAEQLTAHIADASLEQRWPQCRLTQQHMPPGVNLPPPPWLFE